MVTTGAQSAIRSFALPIRVYLEDTDAQGYVYNASYIRFMERARTECLRAAGVDHDEFREQFGIQFVLAHIEASFMAPSRLSDMLSVSANVTEIRGARMRFEQPVRRHSPEGELVCSGTAEVACMDATTRRPRRFPKSILSEWN
jgi:tol-pal system-associated acyl-CoA thioesterase